MKLDIMTKKARVYDRIQDETPAYERIPIDEVEQGLGGVADASQRSRAGSPFALAAIHKRLSKELVSTGGRPTRKQVSAVKKIPVTSAEWKVLSEITKLIRRQGKIKATPSQVAGILLHQSLAEVMARLEGSFHNDIRVERNVASDEDLEDKVEKILAAAASAEEHLEQLRPVARELLREMRAGRGLETDDDDA